MINHNVTKHKKVSLNKLTPCRAIKLLFFPNNHQSSSLRDIEEKDNEPTTNEFLSLVKTRSNTGIDDDDDDDDDANHHNHNLLLLSERIIRLVQENPSIVNAIDPMNGYNALHYLCANPTWLATHNNMMMMIVEALIRSSYSWEKQQKQHVIDGEEQASSSPPPNHQESSSSLMIEHDDGEWKEEDDNTNTASLILGQQTLVNGYLPLHVLCQNAWLTSSFHVLKLVLKSYPDAVFFPDHIHWNLPLHEICQACTKHPIPIQFIRLLIQAWPQSCHVCNRDGNLPLHLASNIILDRVGKKRKEFGDDDDDDDKVRFQNQFQIVQYLLDIYPEGLIIQNHQGLTPLQIAILSSNDVIHHGWEKSSSNSNSNSGDQNNNNKGNSHSYRYHHHSYHQPIIKLLQKDTSCYDTASLSTTENESFYSIRKKNKKKNNSKMLTTTMNSPSITKSRHHPPNTNDNTIRQTYVTTKLYQKNKGVPAANQTKPFDRGYRTGFGRIIVNDQDDDNDDRGGGHRRRRCKENDDEELDDNHNADSSPSSSSTPSSFIIDDDHHDGTKDMNNPLLLRSGSLNTIRNATSGRALDDWDADVTRPWMANRHNEIASSSLDQPPNRAVTTAVTSKEKPTQQQQQQRWGSNGIKDLLRISDHNNNNHNDNRRRRRHADGDLGVVGSSPRLDVNSSRHNVEYYCPFPTWSSTANQLSNGISKIERNVYHHHKPEDTSRYSITLAVEALEQFEDGYDDDPMSPIQKNNNKVDSDEEEDVYIEEISDRELLLLSPIMPKQYTIDPLGSFISRVVMPHHDHDPKETTATTTITKKPQKAPTFECPLSLDSERSFGSVRSSMMVKRRGSWLTIANNNNASLIDLAHHVGEC